MKTEDSQVDTLKLDDNVGNESSPQAEAEKEKTPEVAEKPKSKKFKPPGGVPLMGGPMGFGGALMAEMKKKRGIKDKVGTFMSVLLIFCFWVFLLVQILSRQDSV